MKYKYNPNYHSLTVFGTERQMERLKDYWSNYSNEMTLCDRRLIVHGDDGLGLDKKQVQEMIDNLPVKLAKVKTDISYVYEVNYYTLGERESFKDTRLNVAKKYLMKKIDEITDLANNVRNYEHRPYTEVRLVDENTWHDSDYQKKTWKADEYSVEFFKHPNKSDVEIKGRYNYSNAFNSPFCR